MKEGGNPHLGQYNSPVYMSLYSSHREADLDRLVALKRKWGLQRERLIAAQKKYAQDKNYEAAKLVKEPIAELMQLQRAAQLFLGRIGAPAGDCPYRTIDEWGRELAPSCRRVDAFLQYEEVAQMELDADDWTTGWCG